MLVIVSGAPGAGKTTIARRIAAGFDIPRLDRDDLKDTMFDSLGWSDREWSKRVGRAAWDLLMGLTEELVGVRVSVVIDTNFDPVMATEWLRSLRERHTFLSVEVHCSAEPAVLARRFRERWERGDRHPGHTDTFADESAYLDELATRNFGPVCFDDRVLQVDTTHLDRIDWDGIDSFVRNALEEAHGSQDR